MTLHLRSYRETNDPSHINFHEPSSSFSPSFIASQTQTQKSKAKMSTTTLSSTKYLSTTSSPATSRTASPKPSTAFIHQMDITNGSKDGARFEVFSDAFKGLIGQRPHLRKLLKTNDGKALFHEAGIYLSDSNTVILSSNRFERHGKENDQYACIVHLPLDALPRPKSNDPVYPGEPNLHLQEHMWNCSKAGLFDSRIPSILCSNAIELCNIVRALRHRHLTLASCLLIQPTDRKKDPTRMAPMNNSICMMIPSILLKPSLQRLGEPVTSRPHRCAQIAWAHV